LSDPADAFKDIVRRTQAHYRTVGEMVTSAIRQAILNGVFEPGQHLKQDALAESMGVSRMPVRSALMRLESEGLVEFNPHRGAVVSMLTPDQVREIYDVRILLESHALRRAIEGLDPERIEHLDELATELDREQDGERFLQLRVAFYRELYEAASSPLLVDLIERLRAEVGRYWLRRRVVDKDELGHRELLVYARRKDANGAVRWLRTHLKGVGEELASLIKQGTVE
jgi:DNA-binding GntR family transcriptional regulator